MSSIIPRVGALVLLAIGTAAPGWSQEVGGRVLESETHEPVAGARVALLDSAMTVHASVIADSAGRFQFTVAGGMYLLQAEVSGRFSALSGPVAAGAAEARDVSLFLPSELIELSTTCTTLYESTTVLAGIVYDPRTGVALPGARVTALWSDGPASVPSATSDAAGRYRFCGVPVDRPVELRLSALGRTAAVTVEVPPVQLARADLGLDLGIGASTVRVAGTRPLPAGAGAEITGRIIDADGSAPIGGVIVRAAGRETETVSAEDGRFTLRDLPAGSIVLEVEHLSFGTHRELIPVREGTAVEVELVLAARPLALDAVEVLGRRGAMPAVRASATRFDGFMGAPLAAAESRGERVVELIRNLPGVDLMEGRFTTRHGIESGICLTTTRRLATLAAPGGGTPDAPWCSPIPVFVDDVAVADPIGFLRSLNVADFESIQLLHPTDAQIRYGLTAGAAGGALVMWTRGRGPHVSQERNIRR